MMNTQKTIYKTWDIPVYTFLGDAVLSLRNEENSLENMFPSELRQDHWSSLLKFAKNSKRF